MIHGDGLMEGGSFCILNENVAAVGTSFRGNTSGAGQLKTVLETQGKDLIEVPLPGYAMRLDGGIVMVDHDNAVVNVERLPYWFLDVLKKLEIKTIPVDYRDSTMALNCLALAPGRVVMDSGCPWSAERLAGCGVEVLTTPWTEISKHGGGIHCSTLPLVREND
ncbi:MAG: dimethylarginine dimethylaminohydrolase family protein [Thermovirgaceae bacterium]